MASVVGPQDTNSNETLPGAGARSWVVILVLFLVFFLGVSDNQMISPLLPLMSREFHVAEGDIGKLIVPAYSLAAALIALIVGPASDRFGRRRFLLVASLVFGTSLVSVFFIKQIHTLAVVRFFTGMAAGTFSTCSIAYVGDYFPYERRGSAMSVVQAGYFVALVVGVPLGSVLAQWRGWRAGFVAFGFLALIVFALVLTVLPDDSQQAASSPTAGGKTNYLGDVGIAFRGIERVAAIAGAFFVSGGFVGFIVYLGSWLTKTHGLKTGQVGYVFATVGLASLIGALAAGPVADKLGKRGVSLISTILLAGSLFAIPVLGWGALLFAMLLTASLSFAFRQGPLQALATELVPRRARGALVATRTTTSQIGIGVSTWVCGLLYDQRGYWAVGVFSATMTLAAAICIFLMREPRKRPAEEW
jgi:predicted MFS family arabinose efflux permease